MKNSISNALQIVAAIVITGSVAYAMEAPKQPLPQQFNNETVQAAAEPQTPAETPSTQATEPAPVAEQAPTQPEPVIVPATVPVQAVEPAISAYATGNSADWFAASGISPRYWQAVDYIIGKESRWCPYNWQGEVGSCRDYHGVPSDESGLGYGLCQSTPASKMAAAGADWKTNPVTQLKWCDIHANSHHAGWSDAYQYWLQNHNW